MDKKSRMLWRTGASLVVVDIQERLLPAICERERVVQNALRLVKGATVLGLPLFATEQYRNGLGPTIPELARAIAGFAPLQKLTFSVCGAAGFIESLKSKNISDVLLCGIETHVCVCQSALELLEQGFHVFVVADAVSSRTPENHRLGLERMRDAGAILVSTEMALFELLRSAGASEFKQVLALVK
jgi:nicotinamidase-related amidase